MKHQATFRFYEELNDYLPPGKQRIPFTVYFEGTPALKEVILSLGVPDTAVDLILVNSVAVNFDYLLQQGDYVSVYPVFETFEVATVSPLHEKPLRILRFILDVHLGKLTKYLRMLGFDCLYQNTNDDAEIIRISHAEDRIILTRDRGLYNAKSVVRAFLIHSQHPRDQLEEVLQHFDLYGCFDPFNRCIRCNGQLERVDKEEIIGLLKPLTKKYFTRFYRCNSCRNIYWEGSHYDRMTGFIEKLRNQPGPGSD